jgi:hypothetical protein
MINIFFKLANGFPKLLTKSVDEKEKKTEDKKPTNLDKVSF